MSKTFKILICLFAILCSSVVSTAGNVTIKVSEPRGKRGIDVGDTFWIIYTLTDVDEKMTKPNSIPGCKILYFSTTGLMSNVSFINGKSSHSGTTEYTLTVKAEKEGNHKYGPITVGGIKSNAVTYSIGEAETSQQPNMPNRKGDSDSPVYIGKGDDKIFLRASLSKSTAYEQEALVYSIKLYSSYGGIKYVGSTTTPTFDGFVLEDIKLNSIQLDYETYNGKTYVAAEIARYILFPQVSGSLKILGNTYTVSVNSHEYYSDPYFGRMSVSRPVQLNIKPNDLEIKVKNLPQPQPANFSGRVGVYSIKSELPSTEFRTNQAASIIYNVSGEGNLKYVKLPDLNMIYPQQLEVFTPTTDIQSSIVGNSIRGNVKFDYSIMPHETGSFEIPKVELVYFNPSTEKYETSTANGYRVNVSKGEVSAKSQTENINKFDNSLIEDGKKKSNSNILVDDFTYWLWYIIPILWLIASIIVQKKRIKAMSNIEFTKMRKANKEARKRLKKAEICMKNNDSDKYYDEMLYALWGYISDKLGIATSELNRDNVKQRLDERGVAIELINDIITVIDDCEFAKYASSTTHNNMSSLYDQACEIIDKLENSIKNKK